MDSSRQVRLALSCVSCNQETSESLAVLLGKEGIPCAHCNNRIDLTSAHYARLIQGWGKACAATDAADSRTI